MISSVKKRFLESTIFKNFSYLSIFRFTEIALPLVTYPYLIRVLDVTDYGYILFSQSIVYYFSVLINYGFNISATRSIAQNISNKVKQSEIFSSVIIIKSILFFLSLSVLLVSLSVFNLPEKLENLIKVCFAINIYHLIYPIWFFQGTDKMGYITIISIISKFIFTALIFIFVKNEGDFILVPTFWVLGAIIAGGFSIYLTLKKEKIKLLLVKKSVVKKHFSESTPFFLSSISVEMYVNANKVIIGSFLGMKEVAIYDLANKILTIIKIPIITIVQSSFPTFSRNRNIKEINKYTFIGISLCIILITLTLIFIEPIIILLGTESLSYSINITRLLVFAAFFVTISQFFGIARLVVFEFNKLFSTIISSSALFYCVMFVILYLTELVTLNSLSLLTVAVEAWVAILMAIAVFKKKLF